MCVLLRSTNAALSAGGRSRPLEVVCGRFSR